MKKLKTNESNKPTLSLARSCHDHILFFQRRMRRARFDYKFPISNDEILLLTLLSGSSSLNGTEISNLLGIPKAKISRQLISMEEQGYVESKNSLSDKRSKELYFTQKGSALLNELKRVNGEISMRGIFPIQGKDRKAIEHFFKALADGFEYPVVLTNKTEDPLLVQQRRIAGASGMLGANYMNTGLDLSEYQILFEVFREKKSVKFSDIDNNLPINISKISRTLTNFGKKSYLKKLSSIDDKRGITCELTEKGREFFKKVNNGVATQYLKALESIPVVEVSRFIELIDSIDDMPIPPPTPKKLDLVICKTPEEFSKSREVLVKILVEKNRHQNMIASLIPQDRFCVQYFSGSEVVGVLVITKNAEVEYFEIDSLQDGSKDCERECFERGGKMFLDQFKFKKLHIPDGIQKRIEKS